VMNMGTASFIVRTPEHTILIDACVGNDKRRAAEYWDRQQTPYLDNMARLGLAPEDFDMVVLTHFHVDHVGWCTRLVDGRWVPTFPNASYLLVREEWEYWKDSPSDDADSRACVQDSVVPVIEAGKARFLERNAAIAEGVWLEDMSGHTPGHTGVHFKSGDHELVIAGDLMHHPIQIAAPDVVTGFDVIPERATRARKDFLNRYADTGVLVTCIHFVTPACGTIVRNGDRLRFNVAPEPKE
jgi:glyoxylase-like metal-dependent hydrolase (beta-lactamase superfamily II)